MDARKQGLVFGAGAYFSWGVLPVFWPLLQPAGAMELLAHRIVWSALFVALLLAVGRQWSWITRLTRRQVALLGVAAVVVSANWGGFIWGVTHHHVVETSLGYFINPLITVLLGVLVLRERLRRAQWWALALGVVAVLVLAVDYGRPPWLALLLAFSFGTYGLIKNQVGLDAVHSVGVETALLTVPAGAYLVVLAATGDGTFGTGGTGHSLLLALAGPITAIPLLLFGAAARRLPLSVLGMLQYLAPVLQFASGVLIFHEPMPPARLAGFALVWGALVLLTGESLLNARRQRRDRQAGAGQAHAEPAHAASRSSTLPAALTSSNDAIRSRDSGATMSTP